MSGPFWNYSDSPCLSFYLTFTFTLSEADALKFMSPLYCALMACVPTASVSVVKLTVPLFSGSAPDIGVVPSKNTTVPIALPGTTVATNVAGLPDLSPVAPSAKANVRLVLAFATFWINGAEVDGLVLASPLYCAVMEWLPATSDGTINIAVPLLRGRFPEMAIDPSKKTTVPVAEAGIMLTVNVSESP